MSLRQRLSWSAHLFKAVTRQHHREALGFLRPLIPPDGVIFDVGAHSGQFSKLFTALVPQGHVYAFEPSPYALSILRPMLAIKRPRNLTLTPIGLSNEEGSQELLIPIKRSGSLGFGLAHFGPETTGRATRSYMVNLTTMDRFVASKNIARLDFIKADIEGWELQMLRGGTKTIDRFRPSLLLEIGESSLARAGDRPANLFAFFQERDYFAYFTHEHVGYTLQPATQFTESGDYLFIPREKATLLRAA